METVIAIWKGIKENHEVVVSLFQIGGFFLAIIAVFLAFRRNLSFEKQAGTAEKNLFSDRLSRAIESLGHSELAVQNAGLRLIERLLRENKAEAENRILLLTILHGYIEDRTLKLRIGDAGILSEAKPREECVDVETAIAALFSHVPKDRRRDFPLNGSDLRGLHFYQSDLMNVDLAATELQKALLRETDLREADMEYAKLCGADMTGADLQNVQGLTQEQLDKIIYFKPQPPKNLPTDLTIPCSRAYAIDTHHGRNQKYFVKSEKPWSEENIDDWIPQEIAQEKARREGRTYD